MKVIWIKVVARRLNEDYLEILSAEGLERTIIFFRKWTKAFKVSIILVVSFILSSLIASTSIYYGLVFIIIYLVNYFFSSFASEFTLSVNEIWRKYIIYKFKNIGHFDAGKYKPDISITPKKLNLFLSAITLIGVGYLNYFHYEDILKIFIYLPIALIFLSIYAIAVILREMILPSITFSRLELFRSSRETYFAQRSAVLAMTTLALILIYLSYQLSLNASKISKAFIVNVMYLVSGLILGRAILTWFKALFSIKEDPIVDPLAFQIIPMLSTAPIFFAFNYFMANFLSLIGINFDLITISIYYVLIVLIYFIFMISLLKGNTVLLSVFTSNSNDEIENKFYDKFFGFWRERMYYYYNFLMRGTIIILIIGIIIANNKELLIFQNSDKLYYISIVSLLLGINLGFTNYSKNIINYCLENLRYEWNRFVKEYRRSEELSIKGEEASEEIQKIEDIEDFETILKDLEKILREE